jgi:hypothetical protein
MCARPRRGHDPESAQEHAGFGEMLENVVEQDRVERPRNQVQSLLRSPGDDLVVGDGGACRRRRIELDARDPGCTGSSKRPSCTAFATPDVEDPAEWPWEQGNELVAVLSLVAGRLGSMWHRSVHSRDATR